MPRLARSSARCGPTPFNIRTSRSRPSGIPSLYTIHCAKGVSQAGTEHQGRELLARFGGRMKQWWTLSLEGGGVGEQSPIEQPGQAGAAVVGGRGNPGTLVRVPPLFRSLSGSIRQV